MDSAQYCLQIEILVFGCDSRSRLEDSLGNRVARALLKIIQQVKHVSLVKLYLYVYVIIMATPHFTHIILNGF